MRARRPRSRSLNDPCAVFFVPLALLPPPSVFGCSRPQCVAPSPSPIAFYYFFIFVVIGALVLLTLFVGVVSTAMDEASEQQKDSTETSARIREIAEVEGITDDQVENYCAVFAMLDLDNGGTIEDEELRIGLRQIGREPSDFELSEMMRQVDENESGAIDMAEFVQVRPSSAREDDRG